MYSDTDPIRACSQAITLFFQTLGGWLRTPVRRGRGYIVTLCAVFGALAIFGLRRLREAVSRRAAMRAVGA